jgi:hypothetical protein
MQTHVSRKDSAYLAFTGRSHFAEAADLGEHARGAGRVAGRSALPPQPRPLEARVAIARIGYERLGFRFEESDEPVPRDTEQRAQQSAVREFADCGHPGETVRAAARPAADQICLDLIIAVVSREQVEAAVVAAPAAKQPVTGKTCCFLDAGSRLFAGPDKNLVTDASYG